MNQILKNVMLIVLTAVIIINAHAQQLPKPLQLKYTPIQETKWSMFSLYRVHVQDFAVTDKYNDTCNCLENAKFMDKANVNVGLSLYKNVDDKLAYSVDMMLGYGYVGRKLPTIEEKERSWLTTARVDMYYHLARKGMQLRPYLFGAMHASLRQGTMLASLPLGAGARYMFFNNQAMITAQVGYGLGLTNRIRNSVIYSSGLYVNLNKKHKVKVTDLATIADRPVNQMSGSSCVSCGAVVDTDCDGVTDAIDKCPTVSGLATNNGCPISDRDGDGVVDQQDKCPDMAGPVSNEGCPLAPVADRDNDGILDKFDACPDQAGPLNNNGCPGVANQRTIQSGNGSFTQEYPQRPQGGTKTMLGDTVQYIIYFDFDKYDLTANSFDILNDAIDYLRKNDEYKVSLVGHTDLEGNKDYNTKLSENRVKTTRAYLNSYGIEDARITSSFYGKTKPAIPSFDKGLAWKNRRVEIYLTK